MRSIAGLLVLSAGLGAGMYTYYPSAFSSLPAFAERSFAERLWSGWSHSEPRISIAQTVPQTGSHTGNDSADASDSAGAAQRPRVFSPTSPLFAPVVTADAAPTPVKPAAAPAASAVVTTTESRPLARPVAEWAATVTRNANALNRGSSRPSDPEARAELVREIQSNLKRVGCYDGEVDGSWGPASKRAMTSFTERINASLPVEEPDYILLTMVQGHRTAACGETCPAGQTMSEGRCLPRAIVASAARKERRGADSSDDGKAHDVPAGDTATARVALAPPAPTSEVRSAGKPKAPAAADEAPAVDRSSVAARTRSAPVRTVAEIITDGAARREPDKREVAASPSSAHAPSKAAAAPVVEAPAVVAKAEPRPAPVEPLPGRMTIGGPVPDRTTAEEPVTSAPADVQDDDDKPAPVVPRHRPVHREQVRNPAPVRAPAPRVVHTPPPRVVHAPPPRVVHAPPPPPRHRPSYSSSGGGGSSAAARQRAMVYNLFQRPDRY